MYEDETVDSLVVQLVTLTYVSLSDEVFARDTPTLLHTTSLQYLMQYKHFENSQRLQIPDNYSSWWLHDQPATKIIIQVIYKVLDPTSD